MADPWHILHTIQGPAGIIGYQIAGPAAFVVYADEIDELVALLHGIKVDDAIQQITPHTRIYPEGI